MSAVTLVQRLSGALSSICDLDPESLGTITNTFTPIVEEYMKSSLKGSAKPKLSLKGEKADKPVKTQRPPYKNPYQFFVAHYMSEAVKQCPDHKDRMAFIGRGWKEASEDTKGECKSCADRFNDHVKSHLTEGWESRRDDIVREAQHNAVTGSKLTFIATVKATADNATTVESHDSAPVASASAPAVVASAPAPAVVAPVATATRRRRTAAQ